MPLQFVGQISKLKLNYGEFTNSFQLFMEAQMRQAARKFLKTVIVAVPVYTGMAAGSLKPLARFLRVALNIRPDPASASKRRLGFTQAAGEQQQQFKFEMTNNVYTFTYTSEVLHFVINNYFDVTQFGITNLRRPTPWQATHKGERAFKDYLHNEMPKRRDAVKISEYIVTTQHGIR